MARSICRNTQMGMGRNTQGKKKEDWNTGIMKYWNDGNRRKDGIMECWKNGTAKQNGMMEYWEEGKLE